MTASSPLLPRHSTSVLLTGLLGTVLVACVATPGVYSGGYSYGESWPGYYEPYGFYYNTWAPNYYVAPFRDRAFEEHREEEFREHHASNTAVTHAFRAAPASQPIPSLPARAAPSVPSRTASGHWHSGERDSH